MPSAAGTQSAFSLISDQTTCFTSVGNYCRHFELFPDIAQNHRTANLRHGWPSVRCIHWIGLGWLSRVLSPFSTKHDGKRYLLLCCVGYHVCTRRSAVADCTARRLYGVKRASFL